MLEAESAAPLEMPLEQADALGGRLHRGNAAGVLLGEPGRETPNRHAFANVNAFKTPPGQASLRKVVALAVNL